MKPRDLLNRRKKRILTVIAISFFVMTVVAYTEKYWPRNLYGSISYITAAFFIASVILIYIGMKCPKCKATLGLKYIYAEETLLRCPKCGILFDQDSP
jgi:DNA-directed RNA polymerase subunit RPC12/RpoP